MAYEHKENSGSLFKVAAEDRKSDTWPEYEGEFHSVCPYCEKSSRGWVKAWVKTAEADRKGIPMSDIVHDLLEKAFLGRGEKKT